MTRVAQIIQRVKFTLTNEEAETIAAEIKEALRGTIEQETANADVRRGESEGYCPTCGKDWR